MNETASGLPTGGEVEVCEHEWVALDPIRYEPGETTLESEKVPLTWVVDEVCKNCGMESRWPT